MKKVLFFLCLAFLFLSTKIIYAHGFGVHAAHLSSILALNDQYKTLIENPRYQPYFIYGSIFPDIQYAPSFKSTLQNLYQQIRGVTLREATNGWIPDNAAAFEGLTYEINTDQIPDEYPFGIDTHSDKYALAFAEYLLQQCAPVNPPGPNPGSNGTTNAHDARNMKLAFALGYYAHLAEDVACHDFLVPKITATLNPGDLELIKNPQSFAEDPNAQLEGIIEGIMDYYYGNNSTIADMIYNEIWVGRSQFEPTITQMDFTKGYAHLLFNGPTPTYYDANGGWPDMNPALLFFHSALNTWYNTNPFNLPSVGIDLMKY